MKSLALISTFLMLFISCGKKEATPRLSPNIPTQVKSTFSAATTSCLQIIKGMIIEEEIKLVDEDISQDDWFVEEYSDVLARTNLNTTFFSTEREGSLSSLKLQYSDEENILEYTISTIDEGHILTIELSESNASKRISKEFKVNSDCSLKFTSLNITNISYSADNLNNEAELLYYNKIGDLKEQTISFDRELIDTEKSAKKLIQSGDELRENGYTLDDGDLYPVELVFTKAEEGLYSFVYDVVGSYILKGSIRVNNKSEIQELDITEPIAMKFRIISKIEYQNLQISSATSTSNVTISDDAFFFNSDSILNVITDNKLNFDLLSNYFSVKHEKKSNYKLKIKSSDNVQSAFMSAGVLSEDQKYLNSSEYIDLNHTKILKYKNQIESMNLELRSEVIGAVQKLVTSVLEYDYEMIDNDVTRILKLDDFLDKGKGVCQHYALLSTTLLRALGIPARIIAGYSLSSEGAGGHAWIEAKQTNARWLPIEPQSSDNYEIWSLDYFPIGVMISYEKGNSDITDYSSTLKGFLESYEFHDAKNL
jgi:hypothetical protein